MGAHSNVSHLKIAMMSERPQPEKQTTQVRTVRSHSYKILKNVNYSVRREAEPWLSGAVAWGAPGGQMAGAGGNLMWSWCHGINISQNLLKNNPRDPACSQMGVFQDSVTQVHQDTWPVRRVLGWKVTRGPHDLQQVRGSYKE